MKRSSGSAMAQKPGQSPVFSVMGKTFVTLKLSDAQQAVSKDAISRLRPLAAANLHNLEDRDTSAYGEDRSRAPSGFRRKPYFDWHVANGAPLDLRELILASVLRSSAEPRLCKLRRKPRCQCQASPRPDFHWAAGNFTEGIWRRSWACRPRCLVPWAKPSGCAARRLQMRPGTQQNKRP
jgi:hypothetical protein